MVNDYTLSQTRTRSFKLEKNGAHILIDPLNDGLVITDIIVTIHPLSSPFGNIEPKRLEKPFTGFDLILQVGDNKNSLELFDIDTVRYKRFQHTFTGVCKFWKGGRLELLKNFDGIVKVLVCYVRLSSTEYNVWQRTN